MSMKFRSGIGKIPQYSMFHVGKSHGGPLPLPAVLSKPSTMLQVFYLILAGLKRLFCARILCFLSTVWCWGEGCLVSDNRLNPCLCPPLLVLSPPSSGANLYFVSHKKSSFQVPQNVKSLGNFRGLGTLFFVFSLIDREFKSFNISRRISLKLTKEQDLGFAFGACVNRSRATSRNYLQLAPVRPKSRNHELAFTEI